MDPQGGEGNQTPPPTAPIVESNVGVSNPLDKLEGVVAAAQQEAAASTAAPQQAPEETPKRQFVDQFGSGQAAPPVAGSNPPGLMDKALQGLGSEPSQAENNPSSTDVKLNPDINTVDDLLKEGQQITTTPAPEAAAPAEKTPAQRWEELSSEVKAFLEEVTAKEKQAA